MTLNLLDTTNFIRRCLSKYKKKRANAASLKRLRLKHVIDWEQHDRLKLESSWIYKLINFLTPVSIGWIVLVIVLCILIWGS